MTKDEYEDFALRYKGCGACFPMYHTLSRLEKMWFSAIQKDVAELEKEKCELLGIIQGKDKVIQELKKENAELKNRNSELAGQKASLERWYGEAKELIEELSSSLSVVGECEEEECELLNRAEQFLKESK